LQIGKAHRELEKIPDGQTTSDGIEFKAGSRPDKTEVGNLILRSTIENRCHFQQIKN